MTEDFNTLSAGITRQEFLDCKNDGIPIHKHWHINGETVEFYILNEDREDLEGNLSDYVSGTMDDSRVIKVNTIDFIDWEEFENQASKGNSLCVPENPDEYQFVFYPKFLEHKVMKDD